MKTKLIMAFAVAAVAASATLQARADWFGWQGLTGQTSYFDNRDCWRGNRGSSNVGGNFNHWFGYTEDKNPVTVLNPTVTSRKFQSLSGNMVVKQGTYYFVATADSFGINSTANIEIGSATATAEFKSGTYKFNITKIGTASGQTGTMKVSGGTYTNSSYFCVGAGGTGYLEISGGTVSNGGNDMPIGDSSTGTVTVKGSGKYVNAYNYNGYGIRTGCAGNGTLNVEGGEVELSGGALGLCTSSGKSVSGTVNITGGVVAVPQIKHGDGSGAGTLTIDGGTIKAVQDNTSFIPAHNSLRVYVGDAVATIDTGDHNITIGVVLEDKSGEAGAVTFTGGGAVTLSGTPTYTGDTTVDAGTVLKLGSAAKSAIFAHYVKVDVSEAPADGTEAIEITGDTISSEEFAKVSLVNNANDRYALELRDSDTKVVIVDKFAGEYVWSGTTGANWTTSGNWTKNGVAGNWYDSTAAVFAGAGDSATLDSDVTAASLTFRANATVAAGGGTLTVPSVSVVSDVSATINAPIAGALEKTGPGTLTLGASRSEATTLTEGTLVLSGSGTTLDLSKLTFGTDAAKPVTLVMGADVTTPSGWNVGNVEGVTATVRKTGGDWTTAGNMTIGCAASATTAFYNDGGTLVLTSYMDIGGSGATSSLLEISGGMVTNTAYYTSIGPSSPGTMNVRTGGKYGVVHSGWGLIVGGSAAGTLNVAGGDVFVGGPLTLSYKAGDSTVNVTDGGVLTFNEVTVNKTTTGGTAAIALDNGTIRANAGGTSFIPAKDNMTLVVKSGGGTIDVNGKTITIAEPLLTDSESTGGGMTFKGGGTVTLASGNTYTGTTTVEVGTTVHIPSASALLSSKIEVTVPATAPEVNVYTPVVIDGEGTLPATILDDIVLPEGVTKVRLSSDGKSVLCFYGDGGPVWIGGTSGSLSDASNWANGVVPGAGTNCVIGVSSAATLTVGSTFAASSITFPADSAVVTIGAAGDETLSGITAITNLSTTANHVFNVALSGADNAAVVMNTQTYCVFNGGMTAYDVDFSQSPASDNARTFAGQWTLTKTSDWTPAKNATVASGASLTVKNYSNSAGDTLLINAGGVVTAEVAKTTGSTDGWLTRGIYGTMVVTDECKMDGTALNRIVADEASTGTIMARKFSSTSTSIKYFLKDSNGFRQVVGAGGISGTGWQAYADWNSVIGCAADFDITGEIKGYTSGTKNTYTLDTTGGYKVSLVSGGKLTGERMALNVTGDGTLALAGGTADFQKGLTVGADATLEVAQSGTNTLSSTLALADGATLGFSVTDKINPPVLDLSGKTVTCNGAVKVKLSGKCPEYGTGVYTLTQGGAFTGVTPTLVDKPNWVKNIGIDENGNIYVTMCRTGLMIIIE